MADQQVILVDVVGLVHEHLTDTLCEDVWKQHRTHERVREWTLSLLMRFWTSVVSNAPKSLRQALAEARSGRSLHYVAPEATHQAFFQRCQRLDAAFPAEVFHRFVARLVPADQILFAKPLHVIRRRFTGLLAVDASDLDPVCRRLKILQKDARVPLAGMVQAVYDICGGTLRSLIFERCVGTSEFQLARNALDQIPPGSLAVGDKLYGVPKFAAACQERHIFLLARLFPPVQVKKERLLSRTPHPDGGIVEDWEVTIGSGQTVEPQKARVVKWRCKGRIKLALVTTVLEPERLGALEALLVYRYRWKVERLFADLKVVLDLKHFYAGNTNGIALQLYATAILHTAMRVCQAKIAERAQADPDTLSTRKLFVRLAIASMDYAGWCAGIATVQRLNPSVEFTLPKPTDMPGAFASISDFRLEPTKRRPRKKRIRSKQWRSLPKPPSFQTKK